MELFYVSFMLEKPDRETIFIKCEMHCEMYLFVYSFVVEFTSKSKLKWVYITYSYDHCSYATEDS